MDFKNHIKEN